MSYFKIEPKVVKMDHLKKDIVLKSVIVYILKKHFSSFSQLPEFGFNKFRLNKRKISVARPLHFLTSTQKLKLHDHRHNLHFLIIKSFLKVSFKVFLGAMSLQFLTRRRKKFLLEFFSFSFSGEQGLFIFWKVIFRKVLSFFGEQGLFISWQVLRNWSWEKFPRQGNCCQRVFFLKQNKWSYWGFPICSWKQAFSPIE